MSRRRSPLLAPLLACFLAAPALAERFEAILRSGERLVGDDLSEVHDPLRASLHGHELFAADNPARYVRDTQRVAARRGAYVQMTNGDVLPGRVVKWELGRTAGPAFFLVALGDGSPGSDFRTETIPVRADCVQRIFSATARQPRDAPGSIVTRDGRRIVASNLRFTSTGVEALTESGIATIDFIDVVEMHFPVATPLVDPLRDGVWSEAEETWSLARVVTRNGAEVTYCTAMAALMRPERSRRGPPPSESLAIRPSWALETLNIDSAAIVSHSYRAPTEVPLSLLPATVLEERSTIHPWPWRRNCSVAGSRLQVGAIGSDLGVGMHAHSAIAFTLPAGAKEFSTWVGIDRGVGRGGCVRCRIHRDRLDTPPLWQSDFLRGGQDPIRVGPLPIENAERLVLVVEDGHAGRPDDADPWDIRDEVDWIDPLVTVERAQIPSPQSEPQRWIPELAGWEIPEAMRDRLALRPTWDGRENEWSISMQFEADAAAPFELTRRLHVDLTNAVLPVAAAGDDRGRPRHNIHVRVNGQEVDAATNAVRYRDNRRAEVPGREWSLGPFQEKLVQLSVLVEPLNRSGDDPIGLVWESLSPRPLVENLPPGGQPLPPDVPLTALTPLSATRQGQPLSLQTGRLTDGSPLEIRGWRFEEGFGVPTGSEITYRLDPNWRRLVAILGLAGGWQGAGPYSILLDGRLHWECTAPATFGRHTPALQIDVPIPPGHKQITLCVQGKDSHAAWACAGFVE